MNTKREATLEDQFCCGTLRSAIWIDDVEDDLAIPTVSNGTTLYHTDDPEVDSYGVKVPEDARSLYE